MSLSKDILFSLLKDILFSLLIGVLSFIVVWILFSIFHVAGNLLINKFF